jgi:hypothetical protein
MGGNGAPSPMLSLVIDFFSFSDAAADSVALASVLVVGAGGLVSFFAGEGMVMGGPVSLPWSSPSWDSRYLIANTTATSARNDPDTTRPALFSRVIDSCLLSPRFARTAP